MSRYAVARFPTPVLTAPAFALCFGGACPPLDKEQLLRPVEIILFPNSKIQLVEHIDSSWIWRICTKEHPCTKELYIDERFVAFVDEQCPERVQTLPSIDTMIKNLLDLIGNRYIWGGNWPEGIPQLLEWYNPTVKDTFLNPLIQDTWQLKGVDCSGLLYFAANGCTPRNTSELVDWGEPILVAGKKIDALIDCLLPLDLIVWKGHVIIVLDTQTAIESKEGIGVVTTALDKRLEEIFATRKPFDSYTPKEPSFVVRRWHPSSLQSLAKEISIASNGIIK